MSEQHDDLPLLTSDEVSRLVEVEVSKFQNLLLREAFARFLVPPYLQIRQWGWPAPYQEVPCWVIADFGDRDVGVVYCPYAHGTNGYYWNLEFLSEKYLDTGNNHCYRTLEELASDSGYLD